MVEKDAVGRTSDGPAVAKDVVRQPDARCEVRSVQRDSSRESKRLVGGCAERRRRQRIWQELDVIPQTVVQRQPRPDAPRILGKQSQRVVVEGKMRIAHALHKILWNTCAI